MNKRNKNVILFGDPDNIRQLLRYLKASGLKLGILIYFTNDGVKYRRVLNPLVLYSIS